MNVDEKVIMNVRKFNHIIPINVTQTSKYLESQKIIQCVNELFLNSTLGIVQLERFPMLQKLFVHNFYQFDIDIPHTLTELNIKTVPVQEYPNLLRLSCSGEDEIAFSSCSFPSLINLVLTDIILSKDFVFPPSIKELFCYADVFQIRSFSQLQNLTVLCLPNTYFKGKCTDLPISLEKIELLNISASTLSDLFVRQGVKTIEVRYFEDHVRNNLQEISSSTVCTVTTIKLCLFQTVQRNVFPNSVTSLDVHRVRFNSVTFLPSNLKRLHVDTYDTEGNDINLLPISLETFTISHNHNNLPFSFSIGINFHANILVLNLGHNFNQPLHRNTLPRGLTEIHLGSSFSQRIDTAFLDLHHFKKIVIENSSWNVHPIRQDIFSTSLKEFVCTSYSFLANVPCEIPTSVTYFSTMGCSNKYSMK